MKISTIWSYVAALCASSPTLAQQANAVLDFAEHGQIVAVETLRTPGVWEGQIIGGAFADGWVMRIQTSAGEVLLANSGSSGLQSLPLGGDRRIVHFVDRMPECGGGLAPPDQGPEQGGVAGTCDDGSVLDVLVKWTPTAEQEVGGPVAMRALAEAAVAMSNHVYFASGVNLYMRGVGFGITDPYAGDADQYVLHQLTVNGDGILDSVHAERDALGADLVALITGPSSYCGIAWILGSDVPAYGFSVTVWGCVPGLTFTHEVGHNQGCCHALPECPKAGVFPYSKGHRFYASNGVEYRTVMAYAPGKLIPRLSSPLVPYLGTPTGLALADNARTVRETASVMANFRCSRPFPETLIRSPVLPGPATGTSASFTATGVTPAKPGTQVLIVSSAVGDLANVGETISLQIGSANLGAVIGGSGVDCTLESRVTSVPAELFNAAIGYSSVVQFGLHASSGVDTCPVSEISVEFRYERATAPWCPADINRDGDIAGEDLAYLLSAWGTNGQAEFDSDVNDDGTVNGLDLAVVLSAWGPSCSGPTPTLTAVAPSSLPTAGGALVTLTGTNLIGTTGVTIGGVAASGVQVISATTVTAITPAGSAGVKDVSISTIAGTATLAGAVTYVAVPSWSTLLEAAPDPSVVTSAALRNAIAATGLPWRVRDTATQIEFVLVPPGTYQRGCSPSAAHVCGANENPVHSVTLTQPFYMGRYEVTQAQWTASMGSNPSSAQTASTQVPLSQVPNRPVETVSWSGIQTFLSATGMRLPTEAEWEYAYRAGTTTAFHSMPGHPAGTNDDTLLGNIAWIGSNSIFQPRPVGQKAANGFGLHDMSGNVSEWVSDWVGPYPSSAVTNPTGPASGTLRVYRGGGYFDSGNCRASHRSSQQPTSAFSDVGFRVVRNAQSTLACGGSHGWIPTFGAVASPSGSCRALASFDDGSGLAIHAGGFFATSSGSLVIGLARWTGSSWAALGGDGDVAAVVADATGPALYSTSTVVSPDDLWVRVTRRQGSTDSNLPGTFSDGVNAFAGHNDGSGLALYVAGGFTSVELPSGTIGVNRIARWNGSSWSSLGSGLNGQVKALAVFNDGSGSALYAAGEFTSAGGASANHIAKWNGSTWSPLGSGLNGSVNALAVHNDGSGPALYAAGAFTSAGGTSANRIARWNGTSWSPIGSGLNEGVNALAVYDDGSGPALYAGGNFTAAGGDAAQRIARWNGSAWSALGAGLGGAVHAMTVHSDGSRQSLIVGGAFSNAPSGDSHVARWGCAQP